MLPFLQNRLPCSGYFFRIQLVLAGCMLIAGLTLPGCEDDEVQDVVKDIIPLMSAEINGQPWTGTVTWTAQEVPVAGTQTTIAAAGRGGEANSLMSITFQGDAPGTYDLTNVAAGSFTYYTEGTTRFTVESGTITITQYDTVNNQLSGTFSFEAAHDEEGTRSITNGAFEQAPRQF